jgi:hypothetical protein
MADSLKAKAHSLNVDTFEGVREPGRGSGM